VRIALSFCTIDETAHGAGGIEDETDFDAALLCGGFERGG